MGLKLLFRGAALLAIVFVLAGAWILRPAFVPNWAAAAIDSAATGDCETSKYILREVATAGAGGVLETARQIKELGQCPNLDANGLASKGDPNGPSLFSFGGPLFDPDVDHPNRNSIRDGAWWGKQYTYITCWRRYDTAYHVDAVRIERAVAKATPDQPFKPNAHRAACAKAQYDRTMTYLNGENFTFEKGVIGYGQLLRAEKMGHAMAGFVRAKMLLEDEWRFRKIEHEDFEPYDALYQAAKAGYFPAERMLAYELTKRDDIGLPKEQTYLWLVRAWQSWQAYDRELEQKLKDYSRMLGKPYPPEDLDVQKIKFDSEKLPLERL